MTEMRWSSRFLGERRQARHYRKGRVFLAGDAAHVHSPLGGQGMNTGIGDAMNLGWKLAAAVRGSAPPSLLDTYEAERHPVGASVLRLTDTFNQLVLSSSKPRRLLRAALLGTVTRVPRGRRLLAERLSGIGIAYPRERGDDWVGDPDAAEPFAEQAPAAGDPGHGSDERAAEQAPRSGVAQHQLVEDVGQPQHVGADGMALGLIAVEQSRRRRSAHGGGQLPAQVHRVADAGVHALPAER